MADSISSVVLMKVLIALSISSLNSFNSETRFNVHFWFAAPQPRFQYHSSCCQSRVFIRCLYLSCFFLFAILSNIAQLFNKGCATISEHISNIFKEGELEEKVVCRNFRQTTQHGALEGKTQSKEVKYYNLEGIISVGYRVKTIQRFMFRLFQPPHSTPSAIGFDSFGHRIRLFQPSQPSHSANAFDSFSHRSRLLQPSQSSPSAIAVVSFSQISRMC